MFLLDALGAADPWQRGSRTVTLLDALRQAQAKAKTSFEDQPLVEASVLQTIGTMFANLAEYAQADKALRASLDLREAAVGRRSAEGAESLEGWPRSTQLAEVRRGGNYAREALEISRQVHGAADLHSAVAMNNLAAALSKKAEGAEAKSLAEEALRSRRSHGAGGHEADDEIDPAQVENTR